MGVSRKHFKRTAYALLVMATLSVLYLTLGQERIENSPRVSFLGQTEAYGEEVLNFRLEVPVDLKMFGVFIRVVDANGSRPIQTAEGLPSLVVPEDGVKDFQILLPSNQPEWRLEIDLCPVAVGVEGFIERAKNAWDVQSLSGAWELIPLGECQVIGVNVGEALTDNCLIES